MHCMRVNEKELYLNVGIKLRSARNELGVTQRDVADALGLEQHSVCNIEAGKQRIRLDQLYSICILLKLDPLKILPEIDQIMTKPTKHRVLIGGEFVNLTIKEAMESVRKLDKLLGKKREEES